MQRRKIEVPTGDAQPQFELGDTAEEEGGRGGGRGRRERGETRKRGTDRGRERWKRKKGERRERDKQTPSPRQSFCNYLHSEIEHMEERDFLTFRNDAVKLLSEIQYKAEERKRQVTKSQQATTFQLPEATQVTARREYILTIPETQTVSIPVVQPTQTSTGEHVTVIAKVQQQQPPRALYFWSCSADIKMVSQ